MPFWQRALDTCRGWIDPPCDLRKERFDARFVAICSSGLRPHFKGPRSIRNCDGSRHQIGSLHWALGRPGHKRVVVAKSAKPRPNESRESVSRFTRWPRGNQSLETQGKQWRRKGKLALRYPKHLQHGGAEYSPTQCNSRARRAILVLIRYDTESDVLCCNIRLPIITSLNVQTLVKHIHRSACGNWWKPADNEC